jgi:nitrous oxidase accessory protein
VFGRLLAAGLACGLTLVVVPTPGGAEDALTALRRSGAGRGETGDAGEQRFGDMAAPAAAGWGSIDEKATLPTTGRVAGLPFLQELVNAAPAGSVLQPPPGIYSGPLVVDKPLTIDGGGAVTIDGGGKGTVAVLAASDSVLRGLRLVNSGSSHDSDDACLNVRGDRNRIERPADRSTACSASTSRRPTTTSCAATASARSPSTSARGATACASGTATAT